MLTGLAGNATEIVFFLFLIGLKKITTIRIFERQIKVINRSLLSHMKKLLVAHVERLLRSRRGSNPVPFGL
jgi:hypothetical protein